MTDAFLANFVSLARTTDGGAATASIVAKALSQRQVLFYGELLDVPAVQKLRGTPEFALLELFAYGTYQDWLAQRAQLPPLSEEQLFKLRQLTVVSLAGASSGTLLYSVCQGATGIDSVRDLEDIVISCVYANLLRARLDQKHLRIIVEWATGRDLPVHALDPVLAKLDAWCANADAILTELKAASQAAEAHRQADKAEHDRVKSVAERLKVQIADEAEAMLHGSNKSAAASSKKDGGGSKPSAGGRR
jgi:COP9 signalosome complex subunit 7